MPLEEFIIAVFCCIEAMLEEIKDNLSFASARICPQTL